MPACWTTDCHGRSLHNLHSASCILIDWSSDGTVEHSQPCRTFSRLLSLCQYGSFQASDDREACLQGVLSPQYELYKEHQNGVSYKIPDGTELDIYQKVRPSPTALVPLHCVPGRTTYLMCSCILLMQGIPTESLISM